MTKSEFIYDNELFVTLIQKMTEATKEHKISWYQDDANNVCRIRCRKSQKALEQFAILFGFDGGKDAITIFIKDLPKTFTPDDFAIWQSLKELEWAIQECLNSIEACITSMFKALSELNRINYDNR